jgi:hypothetical protein
VIPRAPAAEPHRVGAAGPRQRHPLYDVGRESLFVAALGIMLLVLFAALIALGLLHFAGDGGVLNGALSARTSPHAAFS